MSTASNNTAVPLSVVMPVYNEEEAITAAIAEVQTHVLLHVPGAELVVVNDGSRDGTARLLDEAAASDARIRPIHQQNRGHGGALIAGLTHATGEYVMLIDSDRQIPLDRFPAAWSAICAGREGVFGVRRRRHDPALRLQLTRLVRFALRLLFGVRIYDANVPFKVLRRSIWNDARRCIPDGTLAPSLLLAVYTRVRGHDVEELEVGHKERDTGEVSIRRLKLLRFCAKGLRQLVTFRRSLRHVG